MRTLDESDQGRVQLGESEEHSEVRSGFPFWNFLPVLEAWVQDIGRRPKNMCPSEIFAVGLAMSHYQFEGAWLYNQPV